VTRVTNYAQFQTSMFYLRETQQRIDLAQLQIASGMKSRDYIAMARDSNRLVTMETTHARVTQFTDNNKLVDQRMQTMETNVAQIFEIATNFRTLLVNALNNENALDLAMPQNAQSYLDQVATLLNVQYEGRYLFSGSRTDTPPVDLTALPVGYAIPTVDGASGAYYQGDQFLFSVRADLNFDVVYGETADNPAFEKLIRALDLVKKSPPSDRAALEHALAVANQALDEIPDVRTRIGTAQQTLEQINKRHDEFLLYTEQSVSDIQNVDVAQTMTKLNADSVSLQASYMSINTLSQLNLMEFLR
jgi:flagellar hook-associated protein 3 FlgL